MADKTVKGTHISCKSSGCSGERQQSEQFEKLKKKSRGLLIVKGHFITTTSLPKIYKTIFTSKSLINCSAAQYIFTKT